MPEPVIRNLANKTPAKSAAPSRGKRTHAEATEVSDISETSDVQMTEEPEESASQKKEKRPDAPKPKRAKKSDAATILAAETARLTKAMNEPHDAQAQIDALKRLLAERDGETQRLADEAQRLAAEAARLAAERDQARAAVTAAEQATRNIASKRSVANRAAQSVAPALATTTFAALRSNTFVPENDAEIVVVNVPHDQFVATSPAILELHAEAVINPLPRPDPADPAKALPVASNVRFVLFADKESLVLPQSYVQSFVDAVSSASTTRAMSALRAMKSAAAKAGAHTTKDENSAADIAPLLSTTNIAPLIDFAIAKYAFVAGVAAALGREAFTTAVSSSAAFVAPPHAPKYAATVISHLRTIHQKIPHVVELSADLDGTYDIPGDACTPAATPVPLFYGKYEDEAVISRFLNPDAITPDLLRTVASYFQQRRTAARRSSRRSAAKSEKKNATANANANATAEPEEAEAEGEEAEPEAEEAEENAEGEEEEEEEEESETFE